MKIIAHPLHVIHWEQDSAKIANQHPYKVINHCMLGRDRLTKKPKAYKFTWTHRISINGKEQPCFVAEDVFEVQDFRFFTFEEVKRLTWNSFWKFNEEFRERMKPYDENTTLLYDMSEQEILQLMNYMNS
jgi:hypothetical protein